MKYFRFFFMMSLLLAAASCGRKAQPPSQTEAPSSLPSPTVAEPVVTMEDINRALNSWMQVHSHYPKDLKELVDMKLIARLPSPPPGKKYVINQQAGKVELADQ